MNSTERALFRSINMAAGSLRKRSTSGPAETADGLISRPLVDILSEVRGPTLEAIGYVRVAIELGLGDE